MAILWVREQPKSRSASGKRNDGNTYSRAFLVRTDNANESLVAIVDSTGVVLGGYNPDDISTLADTYDVKPVDDAALLYLVTWQYAKPKPEDPKEPDPEDPENPPEQPPGSIPGHNSSWGASSSVVSGPVFKDLNGNIITNTAGDPLEGLEKEFAEYRLTKTEYYDSHQDVGVKKGWEPLARKFTNAINNAVWNNGQIGTWKCQGCSARLQNETRDNANKFFWEVTWEFAYRKDGWNLQPWDVGFHQLVDENGDPVERTSAPGAGWYDPTYVVGEGEVGGGSGGEEVGPEEGFIDPGGGGNGCPNNVNRRSILGQDGKPVKMPVALSKGKAKAPCQEPDRLLFHVYPKEDFTATFGELETP